MIHELIHINYTTILIALFLVIFLLSNASFNKRTMRLFITAISVGVVLVIVDSIETYTESFSKPTVWRVLMSSIGYSLRPMSILCVLRIITDKEKIKYFLLYTPVTINCIISFSAFFTDIAFSYDENNEFVRGPLGISAYVTSAIYLIMLCWVTVRYIKEKSYYEGLIVFSITATSVISIALEVLFGFDGFINASIVSSVTFYYMYYLVQNFKNDALTQVLNRHYFDIDSARNEDNIKAIINIDLNDFKVINDTKGHKYGDIVLKEIANAIKYNVMRKCRLYRVGGDEFCILCFKGYHENAVDKMMHDINVSLAEKGYTCAMGLAVRKERESLEELQKRADTAMYENKIKMKKR